MTTSSDVRARLVRELALDLVGPRNDDPELAAELLPDPPSRWYLTGYLVPLGAPERQKEPDPQEAMEVGEAGGGDDGAVPERGSGRRSWLPSSMGLSVLVEDDTTELEVTARWADYVNLGQARKDCVTQIGTIDLGAAAGPANLAENGDFAADDAVQEDGSAAPVALATADSHAEASDGKVWRASTYGPWQRRGREGTLRVPLVSGKPLAIAGSGGLEISCHVRSTKIRTDAGEHQVQAVSLFLVNRRAAIDVAGREDEASIFQAELEVAAEQPFVARPDLTGHGISDTDARIGDLHYRDVVEWTVGHNVSVMPLGEPIQACRRVRTAWLPLAHVPRVVPGDVGTEVELAMEKLAELPDAAAAASALDRLPTLYEAWIAGQKKKLGGLSARRREVADGLLQQAGIAAARVRSGIAQLADPRALDAFRTMNRAIAAAARRQRPDETPRWRPFQLAFILLNLEGLVSPTHKDRETVDLLFFPTGGGKTEAYLGLAAFVLVWRRLIHPGRQGCGLAVLMRYTLRLLTLDQLGRAAAVVCALELERRGDPSRLGDWPFEIGLWVGRAATPNRMGADGDRDDTTARARVLSYKRDSSRYPPIPISSCPWCGTEFDQHSFQLVPDMKRPVNLELRCKNRKCEFGPLRACPCSPWTSRSTAAYRAS